MYLPRALEHAKEYSAVPDFVPIGMLVVHSCLAPDTSADELTNHRDLIIVESAVTKIVGMRFRAIMSIVTTTGYVAGDTHDVEASPPIFKNSFDGLKLLEGEVSEGDVVTANADESSTTPCSAGSGLGCGVAWFDSSEGGP